MAHNWKTSAIHSYDLNAGFYIAKFDYRLAELKCGCSVAKNGPQEHIGTCRFAGGVQLGFSAYNPKNT